MLFIIVIFYIIFIIVYYFIYCYYNYLYKLKMKKTNFSSHIFVYYKFFIHGSYIGT